MKLQEGDRGGPGVVLLLPWRVEGGGLGFGHDHSVLVNENIRARIQSMGRDKNKQHKWSFTEIIEDC